jgi:hypothetical protein
MVVVEFEVLVNVCGEGQVVAPHMLQSVAIDVWR